MMNISRTSFVGMVIWMFCGAWAALAAGVDALEGGVSPNKRYDVVVDAAPEIPGVMVRELPGKKEVGMVPWSGDLDGREARPPRTLAKVLWQPKGQAVAINIEARRWMSAEVLAFAPLRGVFVSLQFPKYQELTGYPRPSEEQLWRRGMYPYTSEDGRVVGWTPEGYLVYELQLIPTPVYKGSDPLKHRITLSVAPMGMKVIRREVLGATGGSEDRR